MNKINLEKNQIKNIIYVHRGTSDYLECSLKQAYMKNPNCNIVLIGEDIETKEIPFVRYVDINEYSQAAQEFAQYYVHLSDKEYKYELFCIQRWFIMLEYMKKNKLDYAFYQDSDVILDCDLSKIEYDFKFWYCDCSGHTAVFTIDLLEDLCETIMKYYTSEEGLLELLQLRVDRKKINEISKWTNVSDMELISLFVQKNPVRAKNIAAGMGNGIFGFNINADDHKNAFHMNSYEFVNGKAIIFLKNNSLYVKDVITNKYERLFSVHFHSDNKKYMEPFFDYNNLNGSDKDYYFDFKNCLWKKVLKDNEYTLIDYKTAKEVILTNQNDKDSNSRVINILSKYFNNESIDNKIIDKKILQRVKADFNIDEIKNKKIIGWGCGNGINILNNYYKIDFDYLIDLDKRKAGKIVHGLPVRSIEDFINDLNQNTNAFIIVLSVSYYDEIAQLLRGLGLKEGFDFVGLESIIGFLSQSID